MIGIACVSRLAIKAGGRGKLLLPLLEELNAVPYIKGNRVSGKLSIHRRCCLLAVYTYSGLWLVPKIYPFMTIIIKSSNLIYYLPRA